jgi:hypothetical protein
MTLAAGNLRWVTVNPGDRSFLDKKKIINSTSRKVATTLNKFGIPHIGHLWTSLGSIVPGPLLTN